METRHLRLIKTIADEKGITKSLGKLFLTQSAVSHQLKDIEDRLGAKLFYRTKNQWILTEEGKVIYDTAEKVLAELDQAADTINAMREGNAGIIRLSTECFTSYHWIPAFMVKMKARFPNIEVNINMQASHDTLERLLNNDIDLGITSEPMNDKSIKYIELFLDEIVAVLPKDHPLAEKKYLEAEDFANQTLIIHTPPVETVAVYKYFLKENKIEPKQVTAMPLTQVALEMVKNGTGILTMPKWELDAFAILADLTLASIGSEGLWRMHYAAIRHEDARKKHLKVFIDGLQEELGK